MKSFNVTRIFKTALLMTLISFTFFSNSVFAASQLRLTINGITVPFTTIQPFVDENGRTQVPFKITLESFGAEVKWDNATREAIAIKDGITVRVPIGQNFIYRNNVKITTDTSARIVNGSTYLPIKAVIDALGGKVVWNGASRTVELTGNVSSFSDKPVSDQIKEKVEFINDETLFTVYAFMNATGYDVENHTSFHPIREQLKKELDSMNLQLKDSNYFTNKGVHAGEYFVAHAFIGKEYPYSFSKTDQVTSKLSDLATALNEFYQEANIKYLYAKYDKQIQPLIDSEFRKEGYALIENTVDTFNLNLSSLKNGIEIKANYLESNWKGYNMNVTHNIQNFPVGTPDIFLISGSPNGTSKFTVIHEFMHSFTVPVTYGSYDIKRLAEYLNNQTAIALGGYGNWIDNIDESFVRAMSTYTAGESDKAAIIDREVADGFFLTQYIYDRIPQYKTIYGNDIKKFIDGVITEFSTETAKMSFEEMADKFSPANEYGWKVDDLQMTTIIPYGDAKLKDGTVVYATDKIESQGRALQMSIKLPYNINDIIGYSAGQYFFINKNLHDTPDKRWEDGTYLYELINTDTGVRYSVFTWLANTLLENGTAYDTLVLQSSNVLPRGNYIFKIVTYPTPTGFLNGTYIWDVKMK